MQANYENRDGLVAEVAAALATADSGSEAVKLLFRLKKRANPRYSLASFCKKSGISSTGYLSDVLNGKRSLHQKYHIAVATALALGKRESEFLELLFELELTTSEREKRKIQQQLTVARKSLLTRVAPTPPASEQLFFALEVFCAFGLFRNQASLQMLLGYYGEGMRGSIRAAIQLLCELRLIGPLIDDSHVQNRINDDEVFRVLTQQILFGEGEGSISHIEFIKLALARASRDAEVWFPRRDESHFVSSVISTNHETYVAKLRTIKSEILSMQSTLESSDSADGLVRFNVQIYPIKR